MSDDQPMYTDSKGKQYRSKHEIPASELMTAFYQDMVGISQGLAEQLDTANERITALEGALRALVMTEPDTESAEVSLRPVNEWAWRNAKRLLDGS